MLHRSQVATLRLGWWENGHVTVEKAKPILTLIKVSYDFQTLILVMVLSVRVYLDRVFRFFPFSYIFSLCHFYTHRVSSLGKTHKRSSCSSVSFMFYTQVFKHVVQRLTLDRRLSSGVQLSCATPAVAAVLLDPYRWSSDQNQRTTVKSVRLRYGHGQG